MFASPVRHSHCVPPSKAISHLASSSEWPPSTSGGSLSRWAFPMEIFQLRSILSAGAYLGNQRQGPIRGRKEEEQTCLRTDAVQVAVEWGVTSGQNEGRWPLSSEYRRRRKALSRTENIHSSAHCQTHTPLDESAVKQKKSIASSTSEYLKEYRAPAIGLTGNTRGKTIAQTVR
jgi:hypothetical protein